MDHRSSTEFRVTNAVQSRNTHKDWRPSSLPTPLMSSNQLPKEVDLRESWWKINNQYMTGSCVGWAAVDGLARYTHVKNNALSPEKLLSPWFVWMAAKETDEFTSRPETFLTQVGTSTKAALDILRNYGTVDEDVLEVNLNEDTIDKYPFFNFNGNPDTFFENASRYKIRSYYNLEKNTQDWRSWLYANGPILVSFRVPKSFFNYSGDNILDFNHEAPSESIHGGHAALVVGYRADNSFILRNSWGVGWGEDGFAYVSEDFIKEYFFDDNYGIPK